jgi:hypothetical protein
VYNTLILCWDLLTEFVTIPFSMPGQKTCEGLFCGILQHFLFVVNFTALSASGSHSVIGWMIVDLGRIWKEAIVA